MARSNISFSVIGRYSLSSKCANTLTSDGAEIKYCVALDEHLLDWAKDNQISSFDSLDELHDNPDANVDYILCVGLFDTPPAWLLAKAKYGLLCFHNSEINDTLGLYDPSISILNELSQHGTTWFQLTDNPNQGDIIVENKFDLSETDTARSIIERCETDAMTGLHHLLATIFSGKPLIPLRKKVKISYQKRRQALPHAGVLNWQRDASELGRLCRALDYGHDVNMFGTAKILTDNTNYIVSDFNLKLKSNNKQPGAVKKITDKGIVIACQSGSIEITGLRNHLGNKIEITEFVQNENLSKGSQLPLYSNEELAQYEKLTEASCHSELNWVERLKDTARADYPLVLSSNKSAKSTTEINFPPSIVKQYEQVFSQPINHIDLLLTLLTIYISRLIEQQHFTLNIMRVNFDANDPFFKLACHLLPFNCHLGPKLTFTEVYEHVSKTRQAIFADKYYLGDIFLRYPFLSQKLGTIDAASISIGISDDTQLFHSNLISKAGFLISKSSLKITAFDNVLSENGRNQMNVIMQSATEHVLTLSESILENRSCTISDLPLVNKQRAQDLSKLYAKHKRIDTGFTHIGASFQAITEKFANNIALRFGNKEYSYRALNSKTNQVANYLIARGIKRSDRVGIFFDRSIDMVIAIIGVIKSGAAYVPLNPEHPTSYLDYIIRDANPDLILTSRNPTDKQLGKLKQHLPIAKLADCLTHQNDENPNVQINADDITHIIYTSGSTGNPKGSLISHGNVLSFIASTQQAFGLTENDTISMLHSYSFDLSICELWSGLLHGAKVVIADVVSMKDPSELYAFVVSEKISILYLITTTFVNFSNYVTKHSTKAFSLRYLLIGGEKLRANAVKQWQTKFGDDSPTFVNMYGPTECTVISTYRILPGELTEPEAEANNIGKPMADTRIFVLDQQGQLLPYGFPGELCIAGGGVVDGYLNRPELTQEKFFDAPNLELDSKLYRSGDLVCLDPSGDLHYIKRIDRQVKIRGFRIELDEISSHLRTLSYVKFAEAISFTDRFGYERLAAFIIPENDGLNIDHDSADAQKKCSEKIRLYLSKLLPPFMVPGNYIYVDQYPHTNNGKINYQALSEIANTLCSDYKIHGQSDEEVMIQIWKKYIQKDAIRLNDNFMALGGDSVISIQIAAEATQFGIQVKPHWLFEFPTISSLLKQVLSKRKLKKTKAAILHHRALYEPVRDVLKLPALHPIDENSADRYPLVPLQQGILYHSIEQPGKGTYVQQISIKLTDALNVDCFTKAWRYLINRYTLLRTSFIYENVPELFQVVHHEVELPFRVIDWSDKSHDEYEAARSNYMLEDRLLGFDLTQAPLLRITLIKHRDGYYQFLLTFHHIICDGWSITLMLRELYLAYKSRLGGKEPELEAPIPFGYYYTWLNQQNMRTTKKYWKELLQDVDHLTSLSIDRENKCAEEYATYELTLDKAFCRRLDAFAKEKHLTLNIVIQSAWAILLSRYSYTQKVLFGNTLSGRANGLLNIESIFGLLIHTLPVYIDADPDISVKDFLDAVQRQQQSSRTHIDFSLPEMQRLTGIPASLPLFSYLYVFENYPSNELLDTILRELAIDSVEELYSTHYPLTFIVFPGEQLKFKVSYLQSRFTTDAIVEMLSCLKNILTQMLGMYHEKIKSVCMLSTEERKLILENYSNQGIKKPATLTLDQLFENHASSSPHAIAAIYEGRCMTYSDMNQRANQLARYLHQNGIETGDRVCLILERNFSLLTTILAVLKVGGTFVPLDPTYPLKRNQYILDNSEPKLIIKQKDICSELKYDKKKIVRIENATRIAVNFSESNLGLKHRLNSVAYVLYTSGSTGKPKGVCLTHGNASNFIQSFLTIFSENDLRGILFSSSVSFDLSILEIFGALCSGGRTHIVNNVSDLATAPYANNVTFINAVPSSMKILLEMEGCPKSVTTLILTGDSFDSTLVKNIFDQTTIKNIYNGYGPTECGYASFAKIKQHDISTSNIGTPIANVNFYVLDQTQSPSPIDVPGELYIGGHCVAKGYLNDEKLSNASFTENFITQNPNDRIYRTGDLVSWKKDGSLEFHGRVDQQVKIHGYRVEPQEIESVLAQHPAVEQAVITVKISDTGEKTLIVFFKPAKLISAPNYQDLIDYLQEYLPGYMIPISFILIDNMPLTPNGKVDKNSLMDLGSKYKQLKRPYKLAENTTQTKLVEIWSKRLRIDPKQISINDNFFDLGGHSLLVIHIMSIIHKLFNVKVEIHEIIHAPTIETLAAIIDKKKLSTHQLAGPKVINQASSIVTIQHKGKESPLFLVHPGGGTVFCYFNLGRRLGTERPVFGIQDPGIIHGGGDFETLEQLASYYIDLVKTIQPQGPYNLGGYSTGGTIAWEMAYQLQQQGETVSFLALIDSWAKVPEVLNDRDFFNQLMQEQFGELRARLSISETDDLMSWLDLNWQRLQLSIHYQPKTLTNPVTLFKAAELNDIHKNLQDRTNLWQAHANEEIEVHLVPGTHSMMLMDDNIEPLLLGLQASLTKASSKKPENVS